MGKSILGYCIQVKLKLACSAKEASQRIESLDHRYYTIYM